MSWKNPEKSGLEPTTPNRLADRKHCALSTQPNPHLYRVLTEFYVHFLLKATLTMFSLWGVFWPSFCPSACEDWLPESFPRGWSGFEGPEEAARAPDAWRWLGSWVMLMCTLTLAEPSGWVEEKRREEKRERERERERERNQLLLQTHRHKHMHARHWNYRHQDKMWKNKAAKSVLIL